MALLFFFFCFFFEGVVGLQRFCAQMVDLLRNETFVTFDIESSLISRLNVDSDFERSK